MKEFLQHPFCNGFFILCVFITAEISWQKKLNFFTKLGESADFHLPDAEKNRVDKSLLLNLLYFCFIKIQL